MTLLTGILIGVGVGTLTGLGVGGGKLLTPALVLYFALRQQAAQGVTLSSFLPIAVMATWVHMKEGNVDLRVGVWVAVGSVVGALGGAFLATVAPDFLLQKAYGYFLLAVGIYEVVTAQRLSDEAPVH